MIIWLVELYYLHEPFSSAAHDPNRPAIQFMGCNPPVEVLRTTVKCGLQYTGGPDPDQTLNIYTRHVSAHSTHSKIKKIKKIETVCNNIYSFHNNTHNMLLVLSKLWSISPKIRLYLIQQPPFSVSPCSTLAVSQDSYPQKDLANAATMRRVSPSLISH